MYSEFSTASAPSQNSAVTDSWKFKIGKPSLFCMQSVNPRDSKEFDVNESEQSPIFSGVLMLKVCLDIAKAENENHSRAPERKKIEYSMSSYDPRNNSPS